MEKLHVRLATLDDTEVIAELAGQLGYPTTPGEMAQRLAELFQQAHHAIYVASTSEEENGTVYGWIHLYVQRGLLDQPLTLVEGLVVDAAHRRQGIGRRLMAKAEAWANARGCAAVTLRCNVIREESHVFYESLGYRQTKTQHVYRKAL